MLPPDYSRYTRSPFRRRPVLIALAIFFFTFIFINHVWHSWGLFASIRLWRIPSLISPPVHLSVPTPNPAYTAVILYLISRRRSGELILSLSYLHKNLPVHPWPIVLFHAGDFDDHALQDEFRRRLFQYLDAGLLAWEFVQRVEFERLNFELPAGLEHDKSVLKPLFEDRWPGYQHMCRFFAMQIFSHPRLENVTYYLRMDTDSFIYEPTCSDPFEVMHAHNRSYGFRSAMHDETWVTHDMWTFVSSYASQHPEVEKQLEKNAWTWPNGRQGDMNNSPFPMYYNNFEIVKLDSFRRADVQTWLDEIMADPERIYKWRWGDAPLRYATVSMFFDLNVEVEQFCHIRYYHQGVQYPICRCKNP